MLGRGLIFNMLVVTRSKINGIQVIWDGMIHLWIAYRKVLHLPILFEHQQLQV